jgi:hypothetical protein
LLGQALLRVLAQHLNFIFLEHVRHAVHHLTAVRRSLTWLTCLSHHLESLTGVTLSALTWLAHASHSVGSWLP